MVENMEIEELDVRNFVKNYIDSFIKWDILNFFQKNPSARVTLRDIATIIGRNLETVERELEKLVDGKIILKEEEGNLTFYVFSSDREKRKAVEKFIFYCESSREARLKVVQEILRKKR